MLEPSEYREALVAFDSSSRSAGVVAAVYARREIVVDIGLVAAAVLFDAGLASNPNGSNDIDALGYVVWGVSIAVLLWRRHRPIPVLVITAVGSMVFMAGDYQAVNIFAFIIALFGAMVYSPARRTARIAALSASAAVIATFAAVEAFNDTFSAGDLVRNVLFVGGAMLLGDTIRTRNVLARVQVEAAQQAARQAVAVERLQIARELHDIVAHSVTVMSVQVGGARMAIGEDPGGARQALSEAEQAGRDAMRELRRMLSVLRGADGDITAEAPVPLTRRLQSLIGEFSRAGVHVDLHVQGTARSVPTALSATAFRIVQEALTNVAKHAHEGATADVTLVWSGDELRIDVLDDGSPSPIRKAAGFGLIGMRERVELFDGSLEHGRGPDGGFKVSARLPLEHGTVT